MPIDTHSILSTNDTLLKIQTMAAAKATSSLTLSSDKLRTHCLVSVVSCTSYIDLVKFENKFNMYLPYEDLDRDYIGTIAKELTTHIYNAMKNDGFAIRECYDYNLTITDILEITGTKGEPTHATDFAEVDDSLSFDRVLDGLNNGSLNDEDVFQFGLGGCDGSYSDLDLDSRSEKEKCEYDDDFIRMRIAKYFAYKMFSFTLDHDQGDYDGIGIISAYTDNLPYHTYLKQKSDH